MYTYIPRVSPIRTEFILEEDLFHSEKLADLCKGSGRRVVIVATAHVAKSAGAKLRSYLNGELISIPAGKSCKTREMKQQLEDELLKRKCNRDTLLIGIGGGSLTDLVGFVASTYMRGVPLILIPTTLLGMADAAIGGKNGVDTPRGKNLLGTFYHPIAVFIDLQLLKTLPPKEWLSGLAEILKHGLISDPELWELCEQNPLSWQNPQTLKQLIRASIVAKMHILEEDLEELGMRRILNFGHTVGHGLEVLSQFRMTHGEAVAIGCMVECWLSSHLGYLSPKTLDQILELYHKCGYAKKLPQGFTRKKFSESLGLDKKALQGKPRFVLIERIGHPLSFDGAFCSTIAEKDFQAMLDWMQK